ncbi:hypothetical protein [Bradyrhizobium sp. HKCCYLS20291]|uniref:hypothetical protein n=1 Tax=Bradyrhizobium sp. HKCCYLS20291 TaxID=3420766 RepID=UPI003EBA8198
MSGDHADLKAFLSSKRLWFHYWRSPFEVLSELNSIQKSIDLSFAGFRDAFVTHREAKQLREIWVLAKCSALMEIPQLKLSVEDPPDGYVKRDNRVVPAEVLEVLEPGRKRGLEYGPDVPATRMDPAKDWIRRADAIPGALAEGISRKREKQYPLATELFVYLNIGEYGIRQEEIEQSIRSAITGSIEPLTAIHVFWKGDVFSSDGRTFRSRVVPEYLGDDASIWASVMEEW